MIGRATQGVKLVNLDEGDTVVDVARIITDEDEDEGDGYDADEVTLEDAEIEAGAEE